MMDQELRVLVVAFVESWNKSGLLELDPEKIMSDGPAGIKEAWRASLQAVLTRSGAQTPELPALVLESKTIDIVDNYAEIRTSTHKRLCYVCSRAIVVGSLVCSGCSGPPLGIDG